MDGGGTRGIIPASTPVALEEQIGKPAAGEGHFPGILKRFDWQLPNAIDRPDSSSIPELVRRGQPAAAAMDWKQILSSPTASTATV